MCGGVIVPPLVVIAATQAREDRQPLHKGKGAAGSPLTRGSTDQARLDLLISRVRGPLELAARLDLLISRVCSPLELADQSSSSAHGGFAPARETVTSDTLEA